MGDNYAAQESEIKELLALGPFRGQISTLARYYNPKNYPVVASFMETRNTFGALKTPPGRTNQFTAPAAINGIGRFYITGASPQILVSTTAQNLYRAVDPTTPPTALSTQITLPGGWVNAPMFFAQYDSYMFICNGKNAPQKIDSSFALTAVGVAGPATWTAASLAQTTGGSLTLLGQYTYLFSFKTATQESSPLPLAQQQMITLTGANNQVNLTNVPQPGGGLGVTGVNLYRIGGTLPDIPRLVTTIAVGTTTYSDTTSDNALSILTTQPQFTIYGAGQSTTQDPPLNFTFMIQHENGMWGFLPQTDSSKLSPGGWAYRSNTAQPEGWNKNNAIPCDPNDGDPIQLAFSFGTYLMIFKYETLGAIIGDNMTNYQWTRLENSGLIAQRGACWTPDGVLFLSADGFRVWNGMTGSTIYSTRVNDTIQGYTLAARKAAVAFYSKDLFSAFLSFPTLGITYQFNLLTRDIITLPFACDQAIVLAKSGDSHNVMTTRGSSSTNIDSWFTNTTGDVVASTVLDWKSDRILLDPRIVFQGEYGIVYFDKTSGDFTINLTWDGTTVAAPPLTIQPLGQAPSGQPITIHVSQSPNVNYSMFYLDATHQGSDVQVEIKSLSGNVNPVIIYGVKVFGSIFRVLP